MLGVLLGLFLRVHEPLVDRHLEDASPRGDQRQAFDIVFELLEDALRQTDGSRCVSSLSAVFDGDLHPGECSGGSRPIGSTDRPTC